MEVVRAGGEFLGKQVDTASGGVAKHVKRERDIEQSVDESDDHPDEGRFEALIRLHLLANKLQDFEMMNSATDELVRMVDEDGLIPTQVNLVYGATKRGDPLRAFIRDVYIHETESTECHEFLQTSELHSDFWRDISLGYFELKNTKKSIEEVYCLKIGKNRGVKMCDYHQEQTDEDVEVVLLSTADAAGAGAATFTGSNDASMFAQASGRSSHDHTAAATSDVTAPGDLPKAPRTSVQGDLPPNTATRIAIEQHAPLVPQSSTRRGSETVTASATTETNDLPRAPPRRPGRPSGTGNFVFRR